MRSPLLWLTLVVTLTGGCRCDRSAALSGRFADLVVVPPQGEGGVLSRQARVPVPSAAMGESSSGAFAVRNLGDAPLTLTRVSLTMGSTAFALELPAQTVVAPSEETSFTVTFTPEQASDPTLASVLHEALFTIESSGGRVGETTATVELVASAEARDCHVPSVLDFGEAPIGQAVQMPLSLANVTADATSAQLSAIGGANPGFFSVDPPGPTVDLPPGSALAAQVRFSPIAEDVSEATLTVRRRTSCPEGVVRLVGRGSMQSLSWAPMEVVFGRVPLGEVASRSVTFSNRSGADLPLVVSTPGATNFAAPIRTLTLPARSTVAVRVDCVPTALGALQDTLHVDVGTSPLLPVRVPLRCSGGGPRLRASPSPLAFGNVPVFAGANGAPLPRTAQPVVVRRLRLENVGTPPQQTGDPTFNLVLGLDGALPLMSLSPQGSTLAGEFQVAVTNYDPQVGVPAVAGRNAIDVEVRLQPAMTGLREATLTIYSNDAVRPVQTVALTASGSTSQTCIIGVTPAFLNFGDVPTNATSLQTVTLSNIGSTTCVVSGLDIASGSDPGFALGPQVQPSLTFGPGQSIPVQVQFDSRGLANDTVASGFLRFSAPGATAPRTVPLSARVGNCLVIVPSEVDFGNIKLGCRSAPRPVQLFNVCGSPLTVRSLATTGAGFSISSQPTLPATLTPASTGLPLRLVFQPPGLGTHLGTLDVVVGAAATQSVTLPLRGVGDTTGVTVESFTQPIQPQADILFVIDDSCSMAEEQAALAMNFNAFMTYATAANVDYRIAVVTTDDMSVAGRGQFALNGGGPGVLERSTPNVQQAFASRVRVGIGGSGLERPFSTGLKALSEPLVSGTNAGFLRDDANLAIIMVTDAPEQSPEPLDYYLTRFPLVKGPRRIHQVSVSVIGPFSPASATCSVEGVDLGRFQALITRTSGVRADICTSNWARDLEALGRSALGPRSSFFVRNPPDQQQPIDVAIDGQQVSNAWSYDPNANTVNFTPGQAPAAGTVLTITYHSVCL